MSLATNFIAESDPLIWIGNHTVTLVSPMIIDASLYREFWEATQQARGPKMKMVIDLRKAAFIHDSGYTLLEMVKGSLTTAQADLLLIHCHPNLKKALQLRGFGSCLGVKHEKPSVIADARLQA